MKYTLLIAIAGFGLSGQAQTQKFFNGKWELGGFVGISNYHGDLAPKIVWKESKPAVSVAGKRNFTPFLSYRIQLGYNAISGTDANFSENKYRNLNFRSDIWELGNLFEFNFQPFGVNVLNKNSTFYLAGGLNFMLFNPKALKNGEKHRLQPLRTEGQAKGYALLQPTIPMGAGIKWSPNRRLVFSVEGLWRKTFTDYLDDVSGNYPDYKTQRDNRGLLSAELSHAHTLNGNPPALAGTPRGEQHLKDWFFTISIGISYRFVPLICYYP